jgi:hypothetical protein
VEKLREVDTWVDYEKELREEILPPNPEHDALRFAALLGNACNFHWLIWRILLSWIIIRSVGCPINTF